MNQALILCLDPYSICVPRAVAGDTWRASASESKFQLRNYYEGSPSYASVSHPACDIGLRAWLGSETYNMTLLDLDLSSLNLSCLPKQ